MSERGCVVVFTKPARPGRVKTRLIGRLSAEQVAQLQQAFLDDLVARLCDGRHDIWVAWALEAGEAPPQASPGVGLPAVRQSDGDLGDRLEDALRRALEAHPYAAVVGSDHPDMPAARIDEAFVALRRGADVVFGPAGDGGYYLVAVRSGSLRSGLFAGIPWSTERVLATTLARCRELGLEAELLALGHDVDTPDDLPRLSGHLARHPDDCPRTRTLFDRWGLITG